MSERMTDAEAIAADAGVTAAGWGAGDKTHAGRIRADWLRSRASEEQKEAVIKALADALDGLHQVAFRGPDEQKGGPGQETYYNWRERIRLEAEDILRLVGRLP